MELNKHKIIKGVFLANALDLNNNSYKLIAYVYGCLLHQKIKDRIITKIDVSYSDDEFLNINIYWNKKVNAQKLYGADDGIEELSRLLGVSYGGIDSKNVMSYSESGMQGPDYSNFDLHGDRL